MAERDNYNTISDGDQLNDGYFNDVGYVGALGEVKQFALSVTGAVTKATLQSKGWAICDGTTAATQGITSANITVATPNLDNKFIMGSDNETSGTTGGESTHSLSIAELAAHTHNTNIGTAGGTGGNPSCTSADSTNQVSSSTGSGDAHENKPPFYELVFFIKVKTAMS